MKAHLASLLILIGFIGCYVPSEGCLEFWAINYDVLADEPCTVEECCTQPKLSLAIEYYKNDSTKYQFNDTLYHTPSDKYYALLSSNLFTHSYTLYNTDGEEVSLEQDSLLIKSNYYTTDFGLSTAQGSGITITKYKDAFDLSQIDFKVGLPALLQDTTIFGADNKTVASAIDTLYNEEINPFFSTFSCNISLDTVSIDTFQYKSTLSDNVDISLTFVSQLVNFGENTSLVAKVAVADWFNTIDDLNGSKSEIANQLATSIQDHITIE